MMQLFYQMKNVAKFMNSHIIELKLKNTVNTHANNFPFNFHSIIRKSLNTSHIKVILNKPSYCFCSEKIPYDSQQTIKEELRLVNKYENLEDFMKFYQQNKGNFNLQKRISLTRRYYQKFIKQKKLTYEQKQIIKVQIQSFLNYLCKQVQKIPMNELLTGNRAKIKKNIDQILSVICFEQFLGIIINNKNLKSKIMDDRLAKILILNFQLFYLNKKAFLIFFFITFHTDNKQYLTELKNKIILTSNTISFEKQSSINLINFFVNAQRLNSKSFPQQNLFAEQTIQKYVQIILSDKSNISLDLMNKFSSSIQKYQVNINKKGLIEYYSIHQKQLSKDISANTFKDFLKFVRFISDQISKKDLSDKMDVQIREKVIKFLQFCCQLEKENNKLLINYQNFNVLVIMFKISYYNPQMMQIIDDSFFKSLQNTPIQLLQKLVKARINIYKKVRKQQSIRQAFQKQNITYDKFIEKLITNLYQKRILRPIELLKFIQQTCRKLNFRSEIVENIMRQISKEKKLKLFK